MRVKREGSALVSVLAITIVLLTFGSIIVTSIMRSTQLNESSNDKRDLQYAAESGIEIARSYFTGPEGKDGVIDTITNEGDKALVKALEKGIVGKVNLTSAYGKKDDGTEDKNRIVVKSEAFHRDNNSKSEVVRLSLKRKSSGSNIKNIFDYGAIAGNGDIEVEVVGATHSNSNLAASGKIDFTASTGKEVKIEKEEIKYLNMEQEEDIYLTTKQSEGDSLLEENKNFGFYKKDKVGKYENIKITELEMDKLYEDKVKLYLNDGKTKELSLDDLKKPENKMSSVVRVRIKDASPHGITVIFVNSEELELKLEGTSLALRSMIFMNKGEIEMEESGSIEFIWSTIYASDIEISKKGSLKLSGESGDPMPEEIDPSGSKGHCIPREKFGRMNTVLSKFIDGWSGETTDTGGSGEFDVDTNPYS